MEDEALVVCNIHMAIYIASRDPSVFHNCVVTDLIPDGEAYVIDKTMFMDWLDENGWKGEKDDTAD